VKGTQKGSRSLGTLAAALGLVDGMGLLQAPPEHWRRSCGRIDTSSDPIQPEIGQWNSQQLFSPHDIAPAYGDLLVAPLCQR